MSAERYAVVGTPVGGSLSPVMQEAAFLVAGIPAVYEAHDVPPAMLDAHVACLRYGYRGFNVTVPHKHAVMRNLDWIAPDAAEVGAVNTVVSRDGSLDGFNTDGAGFLGLLSSAGCRVEGARALVLGAGGAARGVAWTLRGRGALVTITARSPERATGELGRLAELLPIIAIDGPDLARAVETADLVVNATPLGMAHLPNQSPLPDRAVLRTDALAVDLVYGRETPFLRQARASGCRALDGLEMLVLQGAEAFRLWTGVAPDVDAMRAACIRELEARACSVS